MATKRRIYSSVAIVESNVLGVLAYTPKCQTCGWRGKPQDKEASAVHAARTHGGKCPGFLILAK